MLFRIIKHPQFQKMTNYYKLGLHFAIITGGISVNILGISLLEDKYINYYKVQNHKVQNHIVQNPLHGFLIIIGSFSVGLFGGLFYPLIIPFSTIYFINQIRKERICNY